MYLLLSFSSLLRYSLSISDSILCLIICGWGKNIVICLITSSNSWLCFSVFLAFMTLTITASMMFCLSILISLSSTFSASVLSVVFFLCVTAGTKFTLMLGFENPWLTDTFSAGVNWGFLEFSLSSNFCLGLHKNNKALLSSYSGIDPYSLISV